MWPFNRKVVIEEKINIIRTQEIRELESITQRLNDSNAQLDKYSVENTSLTNERRKLQEEVEDLKLKKKIETEDIEHMVKMKLEAVDIEKTKFELQIEGEKNEAVHKAKAEHQTALQGILEKQIEQGEERYKQILDRLPDVKVSVKK